MPYRNFPGTADLSAIIAQRRAGLSIWELATLIELLAPTSRHSEVSASACYALKTFTINRNVSRLSCADLLAFRNGRFQSGEKMKLIRRLRAFSVFFRSSNNYPAVSK